MEKTNRQKIVESVPQTGFFGHPRGLSTLFFTEFWERFSYYGMKAILVYYMYYEVSKGGLGFDQSTAVAIASIYGSLVYMSGVIGGWFADRIFGTSRAVFIGGVLIMFGHIALAVPGSTGFFFTSMVLIVLGTGLLKPNVSATVGELYSSEDARRDAGFSIYYMGINLGAFISPLLVGAVNDNFGFHAGFGVAAVGMFAGLVVFVATKKKNLGLAGTYVPNPLSSDEKSKTYSIMGAVAAALVILVVVGINTGFLTIDRFIDIVAILGIFIPTAYFVFMCTSPKTTKEERSRVIAYIPLFMAAVMFWAIQEQGSTILAVFADTRTDLTIGSFEILPAWFQSANPLFIITLAPLFAWMWTKLGPRQPSTPTKFALGLFFAGMSFVVILLPVYFAGEDALVSPIWLILSYLIVVLGELCLSPIGLSATTKLAPEAFQAQMMSLWFLASAAAQAVNAQAAKFYTPENELTYYAVFGFGAIVLAAVLLGLSPWIQRKMKGIK